MSDFVCRLPATRRQNARMENASVSRRETIDSNACMRIRQRDPDEISMLVAMTTLAVCRLDEIIDCHKPNKFFGFNISGAARERLRFAQDRFPQVTGAPDTNLMKIVGQRLILAMVARAGLLPVSWTASLGVL